MINRRCADDGRREARTQGAPISAAIWARPRTQHHDVQRRKATWLFIAFGALGAIALVSAAPGAAHVLPSPSFIPAGDSQLVELSFPNERDRTMVGFSVAAPPSLEIVHAHPAEGWQETFDRSKATWREGSLAPGAATNFSVELRAETEPGPVELEAEQLFDDGAAVDWTVAMTVTPATDEPSQNLALAGVVGLIGLLVVAAVVLLVWRRRVGSA